METSKGMNIYRPKTAPMDKEVKVTGSTVISAVNNRENLYTTPLEIHLNGTVVTSVSTTPGSANYVNSAGAYTAQLLVNTNDIVYGIEFTTA